MPATQEATPSAIGDQLRALIRLQHIDSRIDQITKLRGDLPEEIRDLEDEKAGLETRIQKMRDEQSDSEMRRKRNDLDTAEAEGMIRKYEEQQLQVRNNREYDALTKEIEAQKNRIEQAKMENEALLMRDELNMGQVSDAEVRLKELDAVLTEKRTELDQVVADTKKEQDAFEKQRDSALEDIEPRYRKAYQRLRGRLRDGRAVVPLDRGSAAGYSVPPQRQVEIRQRNRIIPCEHTGRIIVDDTLWEEIVADM
jgi:predicted  nucleic acid-binding Zn-ribbon protein